MNHITAAVSTGRMFTVTFVKEDGTLRTMTGRTGVRKGVKGTGKPAPSAACVCGKWCGMRGAASAADSGGRLIRSAWCGSGLTGGPTRLRLRSARREERLSETLPVPSNHADRAVGRGLWPNDRRVAGVGTPMLITLWQWFSTGSWFGQDTTRGGKA